MKMPCHMLLAKLATVASEHVLAHLERLVPPLEATLSAKVKTDAVKQEVCPGAWKLLQMPWQTLALCGVMRRGRAFDAVVAAAQVGC